MDFEAKIKLNPVQISEIVSEYIKNKTGNVPIQVSFNTEPRTRGYGYGEHTETVFTGATITVDLPKDMKSSKSTNSLGAQIEAVERDPWQYGDH